ncbi:MAG: hypothetical protein IJX08_08675 [Clostridia bacterium]|nr:hypothetical protein [Clostridia bacterium]
MEEKIYIVKEIEGEYAVLSEEQTGGEVFIALALLPMGTDKGSKLLFKDFSYELIAE